jgi:CRISPR system Cascade subunit CasB
MASDHATIFVQRVTNMTTIPGIRAALRSGLTLNSQQIDRTMHAHLAKLTPTNNPYRTEVYYTVASLIAHNPSNAIPALPAGNLGASFARGSSLAHSTRETTLHLLTRQPAQQLCRTLIRAVLPLRSQHPVAIDFARLIDDASRWPTNRQAVGRAWLLSFYRTTDHTNDNADNPTDVDVTEDASLPIKSDDPLAAH